MGKALRNDYLLVALTVISLLGGLAARFANLETLSFISLAIGAAIGLALSVALLFIPAAASDPWPRDAIQGAASRAASLGV